MYFICRGVGGRGFERLNSRVLVCYSSCRRSSSFKPPAYSMNVTASLRYFSSTCRYHLERLGYTYTHATAAVLVTWYMLCCTWYAAVMFLICRTYVRHVCTGSTYLVSCCTIPMISIAHFIGGFALCAELAPPCHESKMVLVAIKLLILLLCYGRLGLLNVF